MGYWTLDADDWWGDPHALATTMDYLKHWDDNKWHGRGIEFYSPQLGVGKTLLACIVGKGLVKSQEKVYYVTFRDVVQTMTHEASSDAFKRLRETPVLILDEVGVGWTGAQHELYATQLEDLLRFRTSGQSVTIMTTNMTPKDQDRAYERCFSLLEARQLRIYVDGEDVRRNGEKKLMDEELIRNHEVRPIK